MFIFSLIYREMDMVKIETKIFSFSIFFLLFRNPLSLIVQSHGHILLNQTFPQILKTESSKAGLRGPGKVWLMFPRIQIAQNVFLKSVLLSFNKAIAPARPSLHYLLLKALIGIYQDRLSRKCFARLLKQFFSTSQLFLWVRWFQTNLKSRLTGKRIGWSRCQNNGASQSCWVLDNHNCHVTFVAHKKMLCRQSAVLMIFNSADKKQMVHFQL